MKLSAINKELAALNVDIVAVTYDSNRDANKFHRKQKLPFPVVQDEYRKNVTKLGILNPQYDADHFAFGVPFPGIFLVDKTGVIRAKFAESGYRARPDTDIILEAAKAL